MALADKPERSGASKSRGPCLRQVVGEGGGRSEDRAVRYPRLYVGLGLHRSRNQLVGMTSGDDSSATATGSNKREDIKIDAPTLRGGAALPGAGWVLLPHPGNTDLLEDIGRFCAAN